MHILYLLGVPRAGCHADCCIAKLSTENGLEMHERPTTTRPLGVGQISRSNSMLW